MSGSRLGRGRGGRLAVYGGCGVVVVLLVFLYHAATTEMARLRVLHVQCAHQQEALAAQLQVIFEYKVRLEKSLAEEKSSNAAVKQELQQRASREKSLRDKDSIEAMQRFDSLQQTYKLLQTEHKDLQEECKKREQQALEDTNRLEATLQELRGRIRQAKEDKEALEHLKTKFLEVDTEKTRLQEKYNGVLKNNGNTDSTIEHLRKEVFQLKRELEEAKKSSHKAVSPGPSIASPLSSQQLMSQLKSAGAGNQEQPNGPSRPQQVSAPSEDDKNRQPLGDPIDQPAIGDPLVDEQQVNEDANEFSNVRFAQRNDNIVPVGANEVKEPEVRNSLPLPYDLQNKRQKNPDDGQNSNEKDFDKPENPNEENSRQVLPRPDQNNEKVEDKKSSSISPRKEISSSKQSIDFLAHPVVKAMTVKTSRTSKKLDENELEQL